MTTVNDILSYLNDIAPTETAMDFDNCGLLTGDGSTPVTKVLLSLDITSGVVREAQSLGCELIVSHHPVILQPLKRLDAHSVPYMLAQCGISAICMHTNLDLAEGFGVNTCLAEAAGVKTPVKSERGECLFIGDLEAETDIHTFAKAVRESLGCAGLRYTAVRPVVKTVAVSSGAGGSEIFAAAAEGADVLVTGEIKHHEINAANELGVNVVDAGHFKSEDIVIAPLQKKLSRQFPSAVFTKSKEYSDKMNYLS